MGNGKGTISVGAFLALLGVISGALGAHALGELLAGAGQTGVWETAVLFHLFHALALFALGIWQSTGAPSKGTRIAAVCWGMGVFFFSGSLYALALGGPGILGPLTPLGGLLFMVGWAAVVAAAWGRRQETS